MNEKGVLENYLWPSGDRLDRTFTHPVPNIEGLKKCGDFIIQCDLEDTFSTNIMTKYESDIKGVNSSATGRPGTKENSFLSSKWTRERGWYLLPGKAIRPIA